MDSTQPIGIFDSGVGGLTVARQIERRMPRERIVYFGDTARVPYGTKSKETVTRFSVENIEFLVRHRVKIVVVACNTASSLALDFLKRCFKVPVIGVIKAGAAKAAAVTRTGRVGVIGTKATIASGAYVRELERLDRRLRVFGASCPLFVPLVEEGWTGGALTRGIAARYLKGLRAKRIDTLILGCTHYPLLKRAIRSVIGRRVILVDSAAEVAAEVEGILAAAGLENRSAKRPLHRYFASDDPQHFAEVSRRFLGKRIVCDRRAWTNV